MANDVAQTQEGAEPRSPMVLFSTVTPRRVSTFCRQLAVLLDAGIPMVRALKVLGHRASSGAMRALIERVTADVEAGGSFSTAMHTHGEELPGIVVPLCRAGEKAGELSKNLRYVADSIDHDLEVRDKVTAALIFPMTTLGVTLLVLGFVLLFVAPMFKEIVEQLEGVELNWLSRVVFNLSDALGHGAVRVLVLVAGGGLGYAVYRGLMHRSYLFDFAKLRIPFLGTMITTGAMARFAKTLAALLRTGVPVLESLRLSRATVDNLAIEAAIAAMEKSVENGGRMSAPLEDFWYVPELARDMVIIGEESGSMAEMLDNLAEVFRADLNRMQTQLVALVQPLMTLLLGFLVLMVILGMFLPYITILTQAGR
jgi:type IV pilus assembly protein PilC